MNRIKENEKNILTQSNKTSSRHSINNFAFNKLNLGLLPKGPPQISSLAVKTRNRNNSHIFLSPPNLIKNNNIKENSPIKKCIDKETNNNCNKNLYYKDNIKINNLINKNTTTNKRNQRNNSNTIFKRCLLGNDIVLPFNSPNDCNYSNSYMPYYTFSNAEKLNIWNTIVNNSNNIKNEINSLKEIKPNKTLTNIKLSDKRKIKNKNRARSQKKLFLNDLRTNEFLSNSNKNNNIGLNLFETIEISNYSKNNLNNIKNKKSGFKTIESFTQLRSESHYSKSSNFVKKQKRRNLKIRNNFNGKNKIINENYKNDGFENIKEKKTYNIAKKLLDEPNSFLYLMFNKIKNQKFDEDGNPQKMDLKKRFSEYKKDLNKLEQKARFELFNLKKQRVIGNEINMKGRVISTNTFFTLAFGGY